METDLTKGKPLSILLKFVIPLFIGNVFQQLYNMADTLIVGRFVGEEALAAVGSTGTIMFLTLGLAIGLTTGFAVLTSQRYGARNERGIRSSVANAILLSAAVTVILTVVYLVSMKRLLRLMNTPENIFQDACTYIMIICMGTAASVYYNLTSAFLRAVGNSRVPLYFLVFSAVLNVFLDLLLIIRFHMGVAGAAVATVIAQGISAVLCFLYIYRRVHILWPKRGEWKFSREDTRFQMRVGVPMALQFAITASGTMIMQAAVNLFGSVAVAGFTAANKMGNLLTQGMPSMGQAMASYSGQNYGYGDIDRVKGGVRASLILLVIYSVIAMAVGYFMLPVTVRMFFTGNADLTQLMPWARTYTYLTIIFYIPLSFIFVFRNTMQGCGYGLLPMLGGVVELGARFITALIAMHVHSYALACFCDPMAWVAACLFTWFAWLSVLKKIESGRGLKGRTS